MAEQTSSRISLQSLDTPVQQREQRLKKGKEREKQKRDSETTEQRRTRLDKQKEYQQKRKASETEEHRAAKLLKRRQSQQQIISSETEEQQGYSRGDSEEYYLEPNNRAWPISDIHMIKRRLFLTNPCSN